MSFETYDYTIKPIEQFLDGIYEKRKNYALNILSECYEDAIKLDFTDYSNLDNLIYKNKTSRESMNDEIDSKIRANWKMKYADEYFGIWEEYEKEHDNVFICNTGEYLHLLPEKDQKRAKELLKLQKKDEKLIRESYDMKSLKDEFEKLKEMKLKRKEQRESIREFLKKYPYCKKSFDVKRLAEIGVKDYAEEWAHVEREVLRRDIYQRTESYVGKLVDMYNICFGENGSLNGIVVGETGKHANVFTILAGGYNVQCLHCRVLVHPIKV